MDHQVSSLQHEHHLSASEPHLHPTLQATQPASSSSTHLQALAQQQESSSSYVLPDGTTASYFTQEYKPLDLGYVETVISEEAPCANGSSGSNVPDAHTAIHQQSGQYYHPPEDQPQLPPLHQPLEPRSKRKRVLDTNSIGVLGLDRNGLLLVKAALAHNISTKVFDPQTKVHNELSKVKFVDRPSALTKDTAVIFICVDDPHLKHDLVMGKESVFSHITKQTVIVDITNTSDYYNGHFAQHCTRKGVKLLNAPFHGLRNYDYVQLLLVSGSYTAYQQAYFALDAVAKRVVYLDQNHLSAPRITTIVAMVAAGKVLLIAEAITLTAQLGLEINVEALVEQNNSEISAMVQVLLNSTAMPMHATSISNIDSDIRLCRLLSDVHCAPSPLMASTSEVFKAQVRSQSLRK